MTAPDVLIVGGGIIGRSIAWRLAGAGAAVTLVDAGFEGRASWAAAGMLTPVTEAYWGEDALLALTVASMRRWPGFAADLTEVTGDDLGFDTSGVLAVAFDGDDLAAIDDLHTLHTQQGLPSERLRGSECRTRQPLLAPQVRGGVFAPEDGAVDPRRVVAALERVGRDIGVDAVAGQVDRFVVDPAGRVTGVELASGERLSAATTVLAGGSWSSLVDPVPGAVAVPVRPVYGEVLRLRERTPDHAPQGTIRALVHGHHVYLVGRRTGEIVVGATALERGFETRVTAGGVYELLRDAQAVVPALAEAELVEGIAGLRPGTPDNAPIVGPSGVDGLVLATGHHRHGILLTPVTADTVAALVAGEAPPPESVAADPSRFEVVP
jgi:glycine oxidase